MYGESRARGAAQSFRPGLSPRVRGIPLRDTDSRRIRRSIPACIPACTGNPRRRRHAEHGAGVYPRVYGESHPEIAAARRDKGLSPRVRGIRSRSRPKSCRQRSIPACTGNPHLAVHRARRQGVYPRVYGESWHTELPARTGTGLSPRVRGIPVKVLRVVVGEGSIPACTGNPLSHSCSSTAFRVYPRVYGESRNGVLGGLSVEGLSPRVRGIPYALGVRRRSAGSIPACTGNPCRDRGGRRRRRVYPRVYGESLLCAPAWRCAWGLSPRVRGIPGPLVQARADTGSIPACTGNPRPAVHRGTAGRVYPRVYGESAVSPETVRPAVGLSPRVRGIHPEPRVVVNERGSIPACTGNPGAPARAESSSGVYPRVYGESARTLLGEQVAGGLSPRVRGIRIRTALAVQSPGSIPACTGNPVASAPGDGRAGVYPRVYGESRRRAWSTRVI